MKINLFFSFTIFCAIQLLVMDCNAQWVPAGNNVTAGDYLGANALSTGPWN